MHSLTNILLSIAFLTSFLSSGFIAEPLGAQTLKIATLAPEGSGWTEALHRIDRRIRVATADSVQLKIYAGGIQGDERVVLRKMRIGQLHGGGFAGPSMSQILPDILALQLPFLFGDYQEVDYVLDNTKADFSNRYKQKGFVFLGWADIGFVHLLSQVPISSLDDIKSHPVWRLEGEPITEILFRLGNVRSIPLTIPDVLLGLQTDLVKVVYSSPAAAIVLQWFTRVSYINEQPINFALGAFLLSERAFNTLSPKHGDTLRQISEEEMRALTLEMRHENSKALTVLENNGVQLNNVSPSDLDSFKKLVQQTIEELIEGPMPPELHNRVQGLLIQYRENKRRKELNEF